MPDQQQLNSILSQLREERERHERVMRSIEIQVRLALGEGQTKRQPVEFTSPTGKKVKIEHIGL